MSRSLLLQAAIGLGVALVVGAYVARDQPMVRRLLDKVPAVSPTAAAGGTTSLPPPSASGIRKCQGPDHRIEYSQQPCRAGTKELDIHGGTVSVVTMAKPAAPADSAASGALIQGFDPASIARMRDKQIDAAMNR